jgi:hypothetical protein
MESKLKDAKSMNDILKIVQEQYDLNQPLGIATKQIVISGLNSVLKIIKAKKNETSNY